MSLRFHSFTPVPNEFFDLFLKDLTLGETKNLLIIFRQTLGYRKSRTDRRYKGTDWISASQFRLKTGCSNTTVAKSLTSLSEKELIQILDHKGQVLVDPKERSGQRLYYRQLLRQTDGQSREAISQANEKNDRRPVKKLHATKETLTKEEPTKRFVWKIYLDDLHDSPHRPHSIIAHFFEEKGIAFVSQQQADVAVERHLPYAEKVQYFSDEQIVKAVNYLKNTFPRFTVETIYKYLTNA